MSSVDRLWSAIYRGYYDVQSPALITRAEVQNDLLPALESAKDLTPETVSLLEQLSQSSIADIGAQALLKSWLATEKDKFLPGATPTGKVVPIVSSGRDEVYLSEAGHFTTDASGTAPSNVKDQAGALYRAAKFVEANFKSGDERATLFNNPSISAEQKRAVFAKLEDALTIDTSTLDPQQKRQLRASVGALMIDMLKSLPSSGTQSSALQAKCFEGVHAIIADPQTPPVTAHILIAQMQNKKVTSGLTSAQRAVNEKALERIAPKTPLNYAELARRAARDGKLTINTVDTVGHGEGFLAGFALNLERDGWTRVSGSLPNGPAKYQKVIPASDRRNQWGVDVEYNYTLKYERGNDIYQPMADPSVDIVAYGGHSNLGRNKLNSLRNAPPQAGDKLLLTDLCCGADGMDEEYAKYPNAQNVTSHQSTYFRTREHPTYGKIAYESEGYSMKMTMLDGILGKAGWEKLENDLQREANWWGHDVANNWITPNAWQRRLREVDGDDDGVSDLFDMLPSYNTFDVDSDTRTEFELTAPNVRADEIRANRAFRATRAVNTFVNYNPTLDGNVWRNVIGGPKGMFFDAKPGDKEYVRFEPMTASDGRPAVAVQFSSALADMSEEAMRAVLFYEYVMHLHDTSEVSFGGDAEAKTMAALFSASALKYDNGYRDREIFEGLKGLYNLPSTLTHGQMNTALTEADEQRHNYMGDMPAVRAVKGQLEQSGEWAALSQPAVGRPAVAVS